MIRSPGPIIRFAAAVAAVTCAGCASPIKPVVLDTSGPAIRQAAVKVQFHNTGGNPRLDPRNLATEFTLAMEREAGPASGGALRIVKAASGATHVIAVDATLLSRTRTEPGYWNSCLYQSKDGKCSGGMTPDTTTYARVRMHLEVTDARSGKTVFRSDDQASGAVSIDDRSIDGAAGGCAKAVLKALKESGLL
jgi:hypothetical protein